MKAIHRVLKYVRLFFWLKKPSFNVFEVLDVIVDQKPLLLFTWHSKHLFFVSIPAIRKYYFKSSGSIIVPLLHSSNFVTINAYTLWRKKKRTIKLSKVEATTELTDYFIREIINPDKLRIEKLHFPIEQKQIGVQDFVCKSRIPKPAYRSNPVEINNLNYL